MIFTHEIYECFLYILYILLCYSGISPAQISSAICSRNSVPYARLVASSDFTTFVECQHKFAWAKDPLHRHNYAGATRTNPLPWAFNREANQSVTVVCNREANKSVTVAFNKELRHLS